MKTMSIMKNLRKLSKRCLTSMLLAGLLVLLATVGLSACTSITLSDVSHSNCGELVPYETRSSTEPGVLEMIDLNEASNILPHVLKMTRDGNDLICTLHNAAVNCGYSDVTVDCKREGHGLNISYNSIVTGEFVSSCACFITLYFTIRDMEDDKFSVSVGWDKRYYPVDLSGHDYVMIDFSNGNTSYDEFVLKPKLISYKFEPHEEGMLVSAGEAAGLQRSLVMRFTSERVIEFEFPEYLLPSDTKALQVEAQPDDDGSLVMSIRSDGEDYDSLRVYRGKMFVKNAKKKIHLKLNPHKITVLDSDGIPHEETAYDYEGDVDFDNSNPITINY